jgi:hypothetical protein
MPKSKHRKDQKKKSRARTKKINETSERQIKQLQRLIENSKKKQEVKSEPLPQIILPD